jgi:hypothetical protein
MILRIRTKLNNPHVGKFLPLWHNGSFYASPWIAIGYSLLVCESSCQNTKLVAILKFFELTKLVSNKSSKCHYYNSKPNSVFSSFLAMSKCWRHKFLVHMFSSKTNFIFYRVE